MLASIANSILAYVIYYDCNDSSANNSVVEKIDQARSIMCESMLADITPEQIADKINMSYSWFRKTFKEYTNVSLAHYIIYHTVEITESETTAVEFVNEREGDRILPEV